MKRGLKPTAHCTINVMTITSQNNCLNEERIETFAAVACRVGFSFLVRIIASMKRGLKQNHAHDKPPSRFRMSE